MDGERSDAWRNDFRLELFHEFLVRAVGAAALAEVDLPHIVICRDDQTGTTSYSGPYPDAMAALVHAERERVLDASLGEDEPMRFSVAALYPSAAPDPT